MLVDAFENFKSICLEIWKLDPAKFFSAPGLSRQAALKKAPQNRSLTDIDMWLMTEEAVRGKTCHSIYRYVKANNKYMKDYDKKKESSHI